jgi:Iml2/Tetratricopeptide repeat protein 39
VSACVILRLEEGDRARPQGEALLCFRIRSHPGYQSPHELRRRGSLCILGSGTTLNNFLSQDIAAAISIVKHANVIASQHRKRGSFTSKLASFVTSPSVPFVKSMNPIERHAELIFAETMFEKAVLGIVYSGDWLQFIKEA